MYHKHWEQSLRNSIKVVSNVAFGFHISFFLFSRFVVKECEIAQVATFQCAKVEFQSFAGHFNQLIIFFKCGKNTFMSLHCKTSFLR